MPCPFNYLRVREKKSVYWFQFNCATPYRRNRLLVIQTACSLPPKFREIGVPLPLNLVLPNESPTDMCHQVFELLASLLCYSDHVLVVVTAAEYSQICIAKSYQHCDGTNIYIHTYIYVYIYIYIYLFMYL